MAQVNGSAPNVTLYTNHRCPWAHRVHIVLNELGLKHEEVIIDIDVPREQWYLDINPRGLVPSIKFNDELLIESGIISHFLADAYPSHLFPASGNAADALKRARINFFVDTWFSKVNSFWLQIAKQPSEEEQEKLSKQFVATVAKEIEPLLSDAKPFFGGSEKFTLAEALIAPFIIRIKAWVKHGLLPKSIGQGFDTLPNFTKWSNEVVKQPSVLGIWNEERIVENSTKRFAKLKAENK